MRIACAGATEVMFGPVPAAKAVCSACPLRQRCLDAAMGAEVRQQGPRRGAGLAGGDRYGVYGGLGPDERARLAELDGAEASAFVAAAWTAAEAPKARRRRPGRPRRQRYKAGRPRRCEECGRPFKRPVQTDGRHRFCSARCRQRAAARRRYRRDPEAGRARHRARAADPAYRARRARREAERRRARREGRAA